MKVTKASHPFLFEAFQAIDHDSGRTIGAGREITEYDVPTRCEAMVLPSERLLAAMTAQERETVAIGDYDEAQATLKLLDSPDGDTLDRLLAEHFCDYHQP